MLSAQHAASHVISFGRNSAIDHSEDAAEHFVADADEAYLETMAHSHKTSSAHPHEVAENSARTEYERAVEAFTVADEFKELLDSSAPHHSHELNIGRPVPLSPASSSQTLPDAESIRKQRAEHQSKLIAAKIKRQEAARRARERLEARLSGGLTADSSAEAEIGGELKRHRNNITIVKSQYDDRTYRFLKLDNGLEVVLVSDPNLAKAAAAMDVGNGFLSDPEDVPGMAHFLEHMLFLGTEKYPGESEYSDFIEAHGGYSNAYTAMENTNYYFDVQTEFLEGALDRFAQFFISPLLSVSATQREMNAVDAEHSKNLLSDAWRTNRLLQELSNTSHPYHKFGTGCSKTLDVMPHKEMRERLLQFWKKHYHAGNLRLAVTSSHTVDVLEEWVDKYFSTVRKSESFFRPLANTKTQDVYPKGFLPRSVYVKTIEDTRFVSLVFPIDTEQPHYRSQAVAYIRHFIERRDSNSLLKEYKKRGWVTQIQIGLDATTSVFATVQMSFDLTSEGQHHIDEIIEAFFKFVKLLRNKGVQEWRFNELARVANMSWQLQDKTSPGRFMSKLAANLRHYSPQDLLTGGSLFLKYDEKHIKNVLAGINPRNMILLIGGANLNRELPQKEKWYGIQYDTEVLGKKRVKAWSKARAKKFKLRLPAKNSFIPSELRVLPVRKNHVLVPEIIHERSGNRSVRLWYSEDADFRRPHGHAVIRLHAPLISSSPRNYLLTSLYIGLLEDQIDEDMYAALVAGFSSHFRVGSNFVDLVFYGYNNGLLGYASQVAKVMQTRFKPAQSRFNMLKEQLLNNYRNKKFDAPHRQSSTLLSSILDPRVYPIYDMVAALNNIQFKDVADWPSTLFSDVSIEGLIHGNVYPKTARAIFAAFVRDLKFTTASASFAQSPSRNLIFPRNRVARVTEDMSVIQLAPNAAESNSAVFKYWQFGMGGIEFKLYAQLLGLMSTKPIFHQLRTKEQLGYIVWSSADMRLGVYGFRVQVQSGKHSARYLDSRVDSFIRDFALQLQNLTTAQFETYVNTLMGSKLEMPVSMAQQTSWSWDEISRQEYVFNRRELELFVLNHTEVVNLKGFKEFVDALWHITLKPTEPRLSCERRGGGVMSVQIEGKGKAKTPKQNKDAATKSEPKKIVADTPAKGLGDGEEDKAATPKKVPAKSETKEKKDKEVNEKETDLGLDAASSFIELAVEKKPKKGIFGEPKAADQRIVDQRVAVAVKSRDGEGWLLKATQSTIHSVTDQMALYPRTSLVPAPKIIDRAAESDEPLKTAFAKSLDTLPSERAAAKATIRAKSARVTVKKTKKQIDQIKKSAKSSKKFNKKIAIPKTNDKKDKKEDKKSDKSTTKTNSNAE